MAPEFLKRKYEGLRRECGARSLAPWWRRTHTTAKHLRTETTFDVDVGERDDRNIAQTRPTSIQVTYCGPSCTVVSVTKDSTLTQLHWPAECEVDESLAQTMGFQSERSFVPLVETSTTRVDACLLAMFHRAKSILYEFLSLS